MSKYCREEHHQNMTKEKLVQLGEIGEKFQIDADDKKTNHVIFSRHETYNITLSVRAMMQAVDEPLAFVFE